jgi:hypothetical protein
MVPFILLANKDKIDPIVNFSGYNLISYDRTMDIWLWIAAIGGFLGQSAKSTYHWVTGQQSPDSAPTNTAVTDRNDIGFYIEYVILSYVLSNVGSYSGKWLAKLCKGPLSRFTNSFVESSTGFDVAQIELLKILITTLFKHGNDNIVRNLALSMLLRERVITDHDLDNALLVDTRIFEELIHYLVNFNLLTHAQAAQHLEKFHHYIGKMSQERWIVDFKPLLAEENGVVQLVNFKEKVTYQEQAAASGNPYKVILEARCDQLPPYITTTSVDTAQSAGNTGIEKSYDLPAYAFVMVDNGQHVKKGDVVAKVPVTLFDKMIENVKDNAVMWVGSKVGGGCGSLAAAIVMWAHGPFLFKQGAPA